MANLVLGESDAPKSPFLSVADVARLLQLSEKTVRRWIESGRLRAIQTSPGRGRIRVAHAALDDFLSRCCIAAPDDDDANGIAARDAR